MRAVICSVALWVGVAAGVARAGEPLVELRVATANGHVRLNTAANTAKRILTSPNLLANMGHDGHDLLLKPVTGPVVAGPLGLFHDLDTKPSGRGLVSLHLDL